MEERNYSFIILNTLLTISYAGFFAKSQIMFFLLSSFRFCPPLKNDGRSELLCHDILMLNEYIKKSIGNVSCPRLSGKVAALAVERGKCEQTQKNDSNLCTPTRPYRLVDSALPSVFGGSERLRKKGIIFLYK